MLVVFEVNLNYISNCGCGAVIGCSMAIYFPLDRRLPALSPLPSATPQLLLGVGLYYGVLVFNLSVTFWIGESFMGMSGLLMHLPVIALLMLRLAGSRDKREERDLPDE